MHHKILRIKLYLYFGEQGIIKVCFGILWNPLELGLKINYYPVLSRETNASTESGYVQNVLLMKNIDLKESIVYSCGSNEMIQGAKSKLIENGLPDFNFYSDAFVTSN